MSVVSSERQQMESAVSPKSLSESDVEVLTRWGLICIVTGNEITDETQATQAENLVVSSEELSPAAGLLITSSWRRFHGVV